MATLVQPGRAEEIRVASVIASGEIRPVWFERLSRSASDRVFIRAINSTWSHHEGADKIMDYAVSDGSQSYVLSFNPLKLSWFFQPVDETTF